MQDNAGDNFIFSTSRNRNNEYVLGRRL